VYEGTESALQASRTVGILFIVSALLGMVLLALDKALMGVQLHYYALVGFVIIDLIVGILALAKHTTGVARLAGAWAALRILIQIADISQAPNFQISYAGFADYLFNPLSSLPQTFGNMPGIPAVIIDLILIIDLIVLVMVFRAPKKTASA
jgi:hypothetical protein